MAESDLVDKLSEEENTSQNEISKKEEPQSSTQLFTKIIKDFSDFLSKRSVYEAAPENSKVLVFNSDLSFKEMIKAFINEDIYCALIYDSKKEFFIGIITISDILFLFQYIIEKAQEKIITDYNLFIKEIFSTSKLLTSEEDKDNNNENKKDKNFDILKYLTKINYNDYFEVIKKYKKIHILYSIALDSSLLDVLKVIYKVGVHRLVVEETKKKGLNDNKKKENELNIQNNIFENKTDKEEKEKTDKSAKDKSDVEKSDKEKSDKKVKKVKTKKKVSVDEESKDKDKEKESKDGEKVVKKKVKKIKKKKTETDLTQKEKEENENKEEEEKVVKKKVKKIKKKKTETELNENNKDLKEKEKKEDEKKEDDKKDINNFQKSEKSMLEIEDLSNKDVFKLNNEDTSKTLELPSETQNYTGFVTYETVFDFLIYNYYSMEMKEFDLSLEELRNISLNSSFIKPLTNFALVDEEVHSSFSKNITSKNDILPILTNDKKEIFGFLYLRDYLYFVSNCESNQNLTNEQFLSNMYEGIDDAKPFGKERIIFLEYNDDSKKLRIKELLEKINGAPEKKIIIKDNDDGDKLYIISLKNIFDVVVEMNENLN